MKEASATDRMKGILTFTEEEVVSTDFISDTNSSVVDMGACISLNPQFVKLVAWYVTVYIYYNIDIPLLGMIMSTDIATEWLILSVTWQLLPSNIEDVNSSRQYCSISQELLVACVTCCIAHSMSSRDNYELT